MRAKAKVSKQKQCGNKKNIDSNNNGDDDGNNNNTKNTFTRKILFPLRFPVELGAPVFLVHLQHGEVLGGADRVILGHVRSLGH